MFRHILFDLLYRFEDFKKYKQWSKKPIENNNRVFFYTKTKSYNPEKSSYDYDNVLIEYQNFSNSEDDPVFTGGALIDGYISVKSSYSGNTYSGSWDLYGEIDLSGKFTGTVVFAFKFYETGGKWIGILEIDGKSQEWEGLDIFHIEGNLIKEKRTYAHAPIPLLREL